MLKDEYGLEYRRISGCVRNWDSGWNRHIFDDRREAYGE